MKTLCLGFVTLMGSAMLAADLTPLDVKTGEWETRTTSQGIGSAVGAIPPEVLAQLPPDLRAKREAALKQATQPQTTVTRRCIKKEDLSKPLGTDVTRATCKTTLTNSSRNSQEIHVECEEKGAKSTGIVRVEAANSETIKLDMQLATSMRGQTTNIHTIATSKWIGAMCTEKQ